MEVSRMPCGCAEEKRVNAGQENFIEDWDTNHARCA
jgi:hypothetical protein